MKTWLNATRCLKAVLEERGRDFFTDIRDNEASFEMPKQTENAIMSYIQELSTHFSSVCAVAWDGKKEQFGFYSAKSDGIKKNTVPFTDLDLRLGENIFKDSLWNLGEVIDTQKIKQLLA